MKEKNNLDKYTGILFELKIGLNKDNASWEWSISFWYLLPSNDFFALS